MTRIIDSSEPGIIQFGRQHVGDYAWEEYVVALFKAFVIGKADFIILPENMNGQRFLAASAAWALDNGYLRVSEVDDADIQSVSTTFRLTELGTDFLKAFESYARSCMRDEAHPDVHLPDTAWPGCSKQLAAASSA